jgi:hypothetical protein
MWGTLNIIGNKATLINPPSFFRCCCRRSLLNSALWALALLNQICITEKKRKNNKEERSCLLHLAEDVSQIGKALLNSSNFR